MLATTLVHMLPVALSFSPRASLLVLLGYFIVHFFEHTVAPHFHFGEETHTHEMTGTTSWSALAGLSVHTFFDGLSIASSLSVSRSLGLLVFVAILLHKLPEGFTVASIALASGQGRAGALRSSAILALATVLGSIALVDPAWVGVALPVSAGVTLYVAASDLIPEVNHIRGWKMAFAVFAGVLLSVVAGEFLQIATS